MNSPQKELRHRTVTTQQVGHSNSNSSNGFSSSTTSHNSRSSARPAVMAKQKQHAPIINHDEESGMIEFDIEMTTTVDDKANKTIHHDRHHHNSDAKSITSMTSPRKRTADDTKNKSPDVRSQTLFLQTAFWITAWYGTSLATLFLNKIILSQPGASVHILGLCQMTTAAVLGGWTSYGGGTWVKRRLICLGRVILSDSLQKKFNLLDCHSSSSSDAIINNTDNGNNHNDASSVSSKSNNNTAIYTSHQNQYSFIRDMTIVGLLRGATVVLGLIALEHVPVSFVETVKATAPAFTVLFARLILKERTHAQVMLTLIPVVVGLVLCSTSEFKLDSSYGSYIGFMAAVLNNCADCVQNVMSKRMLTHLKPTQLQFYTSVAALALQTPFVVGDVATILVNFVAGVTSGDYDGAIGDERAHDFMHKSAIAAELDPNTSSSIGMGKLLLMDAIFYHLQSVSAYCTMGCMSPVSQSVANTLKRSLLVWASILYFGNPVTSNGVIGIIMVVLGVFLYNHVRAIHQR